LNYRLLNDVTLLTFINVTVFSIIRKCKYCHKNGLSDTNKKQKALYIKYFTTIVPSLNTVANYIEYKTTI